MRKVPALLLLPLPLAGCGAGGAGDEAELTVLAAASLTEVYGELAPTFESEHGVEVTFSFGSSTDLAAQVADGAPGDVLATADAASMQAATDAGVTDDVVTFATNVLVIVTPPGNPAGIQEPADLEGTTWVRCADTAPCGRVAQAVLKAHDLTAEPASLEDDVRATLDKVVSGEADAGLVYASDAVAAGEDVTAIRIPGAAGLATSYSVATLEQADDPRLARAWVDLVTSREGQQALTAAGFRPPPGRSP